MKREDESSADERPTEALVADLRAGLSRCHELVDAARNLAVRRATPRPGAVSAQPQPHSSAPPPPAAPRGAADDPLTGLERELASLRARLERSAVAIDAAYGAGPARAHRDADATESEPPLLAPAPHGVQAETPRGVDPVVWRVLREALARGTAVVAELHRGTARGPARPALTGRPLRVLTAPDGRCCVVLAIAPDGVEQAVLAERIARATPVLAP